MAVTDRAVLARVGVDLGAVHTDRATASECPDQYL